VPYPTYQIGEGEDETFVVIDFDDQQVAIIQDEDEVVIPIAMFPTILDVLKFHLSKDGDLIDREKLNVH